MKCAKCQFENPEGLTFCGKCEEKLEKVCPKCKFSNPPDFIYCGKCGNNLTLPVAPIPKESSFDEKLAKLQRYLPKDLAQKILAQTINKQKEAFQWWLKAVQEGERLGARVRSWPGYTLRLANACSNQMEGIQYLMDLRERSIWKRHGHCLKK